MREHSSQGLIQVLKSTEMYKDQLTDLIKQFVKENIMKAKEQNPDSQKFDGMTNETRFGVAQMNNEHTDNTMYSCGSLAPKLKRGGGCMDHGFTREKQLWELTDGTIFLLRECSSIPFMQDFVLGQMENLNDLCYVSHFKHSSSLKENLFKSLK